MMQIPHKTTIVVDHEVYERLLRDKQRLDWLENNLFNRENINWITKKLCPKFNMWVMFSPIGVQGSARGIIDAAMSNNKE